MSRAEFAVSVANNLREKLRCIREDDVDDDDSKLTFKNVRTSLKRISN